MNVAHKIEAAWPAFLDGKPKKLLIDGKWVDAQSGETFESVNPTTGQQLDRPGDAAGVRDGNHEAKEADFEVHDAMLPVHHIPAKHERATYRDFSLSSR